MDTVLTEIKKEHDEARELLNKIDVSKRVSWKDVKELYTTLKGHHTAEEKVVFPKVKPLDEKAQELVKHLIEEHDESETGLKAMIDAKKFDRPKFAEIKMTVEEHMDEEESDLFKKARKAMDKEELKAALEPFEKAEEKAKKAAENEVSA